jgi:hypothetical protein
MGHKAIWLLTEVVVVMTLSKVLSTFLASATKLEVSNTCLRYLEELSTFRCTLEAEKKKTKHKQLVRG